MAHAPRVPRPDSNEAIAARMTLLRRAYSMAQGHTREMNKSDFPRLCGIGIQAWHNCESGYSRIGLDNAIRLRERTGVSLDFIYFNNRLGLPNAIATAMEKLEAAEKPPARVKRAST